VYVRPLSGSRVLAVCIDFPDIAAEGESLATALRSLEAGAARRLRHCSPAVQAAFSSPRDPVVELVPVRVTMEGDRSEPVNIKIGLVSWPQATSSGELRVLRAPMVMGWEMAVNEPDESHRRACDALANYLSDCGLAAVLGADEVEVPSLTWLDVTETGPGRAWMPPSDEENDFRLEDVGDDLTSLAAAGRLGRLDHRDPIVDRVLSALATPGMSSVLLVGPPDVGKSALIGEVAARIQAEDVPPALKGRAMWRLSANELISGARYTGMWQERGRMLLERARDGRLILAMGDPHRHRGRRALEREF
jgi:hypothetical protein